MALLKDLIVTGASKFIGDAYFNLIKSGTWNGSTITVPYGGTGLSSLSSATAGQCLVVNSDKSGFTFATKDNSGNTTYTIASGDANGQIKVTPSSGSAYNVSVKGLGSNAYTSTSYLPTSGGTITRTDSEIGLTIICRGGYSTIKFQNSLDPAKYRTFGIRGDGNLFVTNESGWNNEYLIYHQGNLSPMTTSHAANNITSTKISNWDSVYTWYTTALTADADDVIDTWLEVKDFVKGFKADTSKDLATYLLDTYVTKATTLTISGNKTFTGANTFSLAINADILGTATQANRWSNTHNFTIKDSDNTNSGTATSVDGSTDYILNLPSTIKASLSGTASGNLTTISYDSTNKKITLTKNGNTTDVVSFGSNAFNSTAYLPKAGGEITGTVYFTRDIDDTYRYRSYWELTNGIMTFRNAKRKKSDDSFVLYEDIIIGCTLEANAMNSYKGLYYDASEKNWGIGTMAPAYRFDVSGSINGTSIYLNGTALGTASIHAHDEYVLITGNQSIGGNKTFTGNTVFSGSSTTMDSLTAGNLVVQGTSSLGTVTSGIWNASKIDKSYLTLNSITAGTAGTSSATSGTSISIPYVTMDSLGLVTGYGTHTHTISLPTGNKTAHLYIGPSGSTATTATANGSTYIKLYEDSTAKESYKISGSGTVSVANDANGNITITGSTTATTKTLKTKAAPDETVSTTDWKRACYLTNSGSAQSSSNAWLPAGLYGIYVEDRLSSTATAFNAYSATFTCHGDNVGRLDEIALHSLQSTASDTERPTRIYLAVNAGELKMTTLAPASGSNDHYLTIKVNRII